MSKPRPIYASATVEQAKSAFDALGAAYSEGQLGDVGWLIEALSQAFPSLAAEYAWVTPKPPEDKP